MHPIQLCTHFYCVSLSVFIAFQKLMIIEVDWIDFYFFISLSFCLATFTLSCCFSYFIWIVAWCNWNVCIMITRAKWKIKQKGANPGISWMKMEKVLLIFFFRMLNFFLCIYKCKIISYVGIRLCIMRV